MNYNILVVDDETDLFDLFKRRFRNEINEGSLSFDFAENGLLALDILKQKKIHLVFTDIRMPVMDGLTLLFKINELQLEMKTIVVSAYDDMSNIRSAMNNEAFDFLVKPISFEDLRITLEKSLRAYNNYVDGLETRKKLVEAVKEKEAAILRERLRISRDLHDDIGASLSGISISADTAQKKLAENKMEDVSAFLKRINADAQDMVTSMSEMVWLINPKNDSMEKLFDRIRSYAASVLPAKNILFDFNDEVSLNPLVLSIESRKNIYHILKEAINNAVKYSECTQVKLVLQKSKNKVDFVLSDNGNGFDKSRINLGNGLKNMQQRADEINSIFAIESNAKGTTIKLTVAFT